MLDSTVLHSEHRWRRRGSIERVRQRARTTRRTSTASGAVCRPVRLVAPAVVIRTHRLRVVGVALSGERAARVGRIPADVDRAGSTGRRLCAFEFFMNEFFVFSLLKKVRHRLLLSARVVEVRRIQPAFDGAFHTRII
jgi:hypothetical protein